MSNQQRRIITGIVLLLGSVCLLLFGFPSYVYFLVSLLILYISVYESLKISGATYIASALMQILSMILGLVMYYLTMQSSSLLMPSLIMIQLIYVVVMITMLIIVKPNQLKPSSVLVLGLLLPIVLSA